MKVLFCICLLFSSTLLPAQKDLTYGDLLKKTKEINFTDSFLVETSSVEHTTLDTATLKTYFQFIYPPLNTKQNKSMEYFISGKITSNPYFDILFVSTKKENEDNTLFENVYLLTNKKDGSNISILAVAMKRERETIASSHSWIHKDNKILVSTNIISKERKIGGQSIYRINEEGRFVHYPHWTK